MNKLSYWLEAVDSSFDEHGVLSTEELRLKIAEDMLAAYDNIGMAFYEPTGDGAESLIEKLRKELREEKSKEVCNECKGKGGWNIGMGTFTSPQTCNRCDGSGKVLPSKQKINY